MIVAVKKNGITYAQEMIAIEQEGKEWKKYSCELKVSDDLEKADFVVTLCGAAVMAFESAWYASSCQLSLCLQTAKNWKNTFRMQSIS